MIVVYLTSFVLDQRIIRAVLRQSHMRKEPKNATFKSSVKRLNETFVWLLKMKRLHIPDNEIETALFWLTRGQAECSECHFTKLPLDTIIMSVSLNTANSENFTMSSFILRKRGSSVDSPNKVEIRSGEGSYHPDDRMVISDSNQEYITFKFKTSQTLLFQEENGSPVYRADLTKDHLKPALMLRIDTFHENDPIATKFSIVTSFAGSQVRLFDQKDQKEVQSGLRGWTIALIVVLVLLVLVLACLAYYCCRRKKDANKRAQSQ